MYFITDSYYIQFQCDAIYTYIYIMHDKQLHVDDDHCTGSGGVIANSYVHTVGEYGVVLY